jgi:hypothetical protein
MEATVAMVAIGSAGTVATLRRGDPPAVPATIAYFTLMEALQVGGHATVDRCALPANQVWTVLSYLHICFQPFFINAFALAVTRADPPPALRAGVWIACGVSAVTMLLQLYPFDWAGACVPGYGFCGAPLCTVSGNWHIGWQIPLNDLMAPARALLHTFGSHPTYLVAAFLVPLAYGAWRLVVWHALSGPILASLLTDDPREMAAIWCLFSIGILLVALVPWLRGRMAAAPRPAA